MNAAPTENECRRTRRYAGQIRDLDYESKIIITTTTTATEFSLSGSSPYTSTDKTSKNKYI